MEKAGHRNDDRHCVLNEWKGIEIDSKQQKFSCGKVGSSTPWEENGSPSNE